MLRRHVRCHACASRVLLSPSGVGAEMAQWVQQVLHRPGLSSVLRAHFRVDGRSSSAELPSDLHMGAVACVPLPRLHTTAIVKYKSKEIIEVVKGLGKRSDVLRT